MIARFLSWATTLKFSDKDFYFTENGQTAFQQVDLKGNGFYYQLKSSYDQIIFYYYEFSETLQTFALVFF